MRLVLSIIITLGAFTSATTISVNKYGSGISVIAANMSIVTDTVCLSDAEISNSLQSLTAARTYSEQEQSLTNLRRSAKGSSLCRKQVRSSYRCHGQTYN
jgi:hypothetical protein